MYEQILTYITALAPSLATIITAIVMFVRIIGRTREIATSLKDDTAKQVRDAANAMNAQTAMLREAVSTVNSTSEVKAIKEQNRQLLKDLDEAMRLNAELLAKLNLSH